MLKSRFLTVNTLKEINWSFLLLDSNPRTRTLIDTGVILSVGDGVALVIGLLNVGVGEIVVFQNQIKDFRGYGERFFIDYIVTKRGNRLTWVFGKYEKIKVQAGKGIWQQVGFNIFRV